MRAFGSHKKLIDAARHWAGSYDYSDEALGIAPDASVVEQLELASAPQDVIDEAKARADAATKVEDFEVWEDCWDAWMFFLSLRGQWQHAVGMGTVIRTGLPFDRVLAAMVMQPVARSARPQLFQDIKLIEGAVRMADRDIADKRANQ